MSYIKKHSKKTAIIIEDPRVGGPHKQLVYFINSLKKKNLKDLEIFVYAPQNILSLINNKYIKKKKLSFNYLNFKNLFNYFFSIFKDCKSISYFLKKNKISQVYVAGGSLCFKAIIASLASKKKIIWHIHDTKSNIFIKILIKILINKVNQVIFASQKSKKFYLPYQTKNINIFHSAVDTKYFKRKISNGKKQFNVCIVANISPDKDIITFLKVAKYTKGLSNKIKFNLYGNVWKSQVKYYNYCKNFIVVNKINNLKIKKFSNKIKNVYNNNDLLISTSKNESMPLVICEAMSMSLPVLSTDTGDIKKFVNYKNTNAGFIIKNNKVKNFGNKIYIISKNRSLYKKLSSNSRNIAKEKFNINNYKLKLINLLNQL